MLRVSATSLVLLSGISRMVELRTAGVRMSANAARKSACATVLC